MGGNRPAPAGVFISKPTMHADTLIVLSTLGLAIFSAVLWIFALVSALKHELLDSTMKLVWVVVIIFVPGAGALIYLCVAPKRPGRMQFAMAELYHRKRRFARQAGLRPGGPDSS
jgi:hypothetical protein